MTLTSNRFDLNADGRDSAFLTATVKDSQRNAMAGMTVNFVISASTISGALGNLSTSLARTDSAGNAHTTYTAPSLTFVPSNSTVTIKAVVQQGGQAEFLPSAQLTLLLRPKGEGSDTSEDGGVGTGLNPVIAAVTPDAVFFSRPTDVIVQGTNFAEQSQILIINAELGLITVRPVFLSSTQLQFTSPIVSQAGAATLFVSAPPNLLSIGVPFSFIVEGSTPGEEPGVINPPSISELVPNQGPVLQNDIVVIALGSGFQEGLTVTFVSPSMNPPKTARVTNVRPNRVEMVAPMAEATESGETSVFISNPDGQISNTVIFTYTSEQANAPILTAVSPTAGPTTGGTQLTISGSNLQPSDVVVFASPTIPGGQVTICGPSGPATCDNKTGALKDPSCNPGNVADFDLVGPGQIRVLTQCVGLTGAGPVDLFIQNQNNQVSNFLQWTYITTPSLRPPIVSAVDPAGIAQVCGQQTLTPPPGTNVCLRCRNCFLCDPATCGISGNCADNDGAPDINNFADTCEPCVNGCGTNAFCGSSNTQGAGGLGFADTCSQCSGFVGCEYDGYQVLITGANFDRCASIIMVHNARIHEFLPDPNGNDHMPGTGDECTFEDPNVTAIALGGTCVASAPDLIPWPHFTYVPVGSTTCQSFDAPDPLTDGKIRWVNEGEMRLERGPLQRLSCDSEDQATIYVSNNPGTGITGDAISGPAAFPFLCQEP